MRSFLHFAFGLVAVLFTQSSAFAAGYSLEQVTYEAPRMAGLSSPSETRSGLIETIPAGDRVFQVFYSTSNEPTAVELRDAVSNELIAFRHRGMSASQTYWSDWMPGSLRAAMITPWPTQETVTARRALHTRASSVILTPEATAELAQALNAAPQTPQDTWTPFSKRVNWSRAAEYSWSIDTSKYELWAGYLWEFGKGQLWKGYRKPGKHDHWITPSQEQGDFKRSEVERYYRENGSKPSFQVAAYNAESSRNLSPLDKFGIWASRAHPESTYARDWKQASMWESINKHDSFQWGGYCNGSVASSILFKKPKHSFVDKGITWDPRDVAGVAQSANYVVDFIQMGYRCQTWSCGKKGDTSGEARMDEPAADFAVDMLEYYVGTRGTPLAADLEANAEVGNEVIYKARLKISERGKNERYGQLFVESVTNFDDNTIDQDEVGELPDLDPKKSFTHNVYGFKIYLKPDGSLDHTEWDQEKYHPDFFWLPTGVRDAEAYWPGGVAPADGTGWAKNPYLRVDWVKDLLMKSL